MTLSTDWILRYCSSHSARVRLDGAGLMLDLVQHKLLMLPELQALHLLAWAKRNGVPHAFTIVQRPTGRTP